MLVHLSNISPYVCDLNRGPIEQANRMASAPTKKATALLEQKESFPKATRTPLKLLAPDEVPMDTTATATDINASLQPIWYTEQTIVDDSHVQQEDIASIIQEQQQKGRSLRPRTTLPTIPSESPSINEIEPLPTQPSLMHKSSTFVIETSINTDSPLNDSEKENTTNQIIPPSDDSFRELEHLLGLGSGTTTVRESPKTNHDTLSLTVVTPTDIINSTSASLRMSYARKSGPGSLPSSQEIPTMPTIESLTSTNPPSFLMDNTAVEEEQPSITTTTNQQTSFDLTDNDTIKDDTNNDDETNFSFELNDFPNNSENELITNVPEPTPPQPMITIRAPTCADVAYRALIKPRAGGRVSQPVKADSPLAKPNKLRSSAPTSRMLRSSCRRISTDAASQNSTTEEQPISTTECFINGTETDIESQWELVEVVTLPEEDEHEQEKTTSVTLNVTSSKMPEEINQNASIQSEEFSTPTKPLIPLLSREYTYDTPKLRTSERHRSMLNASRATPIQQQQTTINEEQPNSPSIASKSMLGVLLTQPTEAQPNDLQKTITTPSSVRASTRRTINQEQPNSPSIASKSMLGVLLTQPTEAQPSVLQTTITTPSVRASKRKTINEEQPNSPSIASKSMLGILLTQPTEALPSVLQTTITTPSSVRASTRRTINQEQPNSPSIVSKSMLGVLLTQPTEAQPSVLQTAITTPSSVRASKRKTINEEQPNSPTIASKSMLGILLTQPTEAQPNDLQKTITTPSSVRASTRRTINEEATNTPSIDSNSMLEILLTKPTEAEPSVLQKTLTTSIVPSPVRTSTRKTDRLSTNPTPRVSINPLHSSTPSSTRHKSLQMVSIGEQEQVTTTVPQQINIEIQEEIQEEEQQIEMAPLNDTEQSIQQSSSLPTTEIDISSDRRFNAFEQQTTQTIEINKSSSIVIVNEKQHSQLTPLQTKLIMNLQRNVRFQLTPSTDARLAVKEKLEENLRGLKPDIIIKPTPVLPQTKQQIVKRVKAAPVKRLTKPKKKIITPKKKKVATTKKTESKKQPIVKKSRQPRKAPQKEKPVPPKKEAKKKPEVVPPKKETKKKSKVVPPTKKTEKKPKVAPPTKISKTKPKVVPSTKVSKKKPEVAPPTKRTQRKRPAVEVSPPTKRTARKRTIPEVNTTPVEPVTKRAKISKSIEVKKQPIEAALPPLPPKARNATTKNKKNISKPIEQQPKTRRGSTNNKKIIPEPIEQQPKTRNGSINNKKSISDPAPRQTRARSHSTNNTKNITEPIKEQPKIKAEPKNITPAIRTSKRRLQSVDKTEGLKKKVEEKKIQSIPPVQNKELSQEEQKKIEALTVAGLKSRLNKHKENVPKGAKKADLIALLIKIETNLLKKQEKAEVATVDTTAKTTRRRKK